MKKLLPLILFTAITSFMAVGQNVKIEVPIVKTGVADIEIEDDEGIVIDTVTISVSFDDAEQENDEMDTMIDDDLDAGWEGDPEDLNVLTTGLRFQNVNIPKGAVIDSAFIVVTSHEAKSAEDVAIIYLSGLAYDNAAMFTEDKLLTSYDQTTTSVKWTIAEEWGLWTNHKSADIKSIIQELVNREGWSFGNSLGILLKGSDEQGASEFENAREFESFENISDPEDGGDGLNHPERVPKLVVYYTAESATLIVPIIKTGTAEIEVEDEEGNVVDTITINVSYDDAEQENDEMDSMIDDDLDAGWEGDPEDFNVLTTGLRFQNITIPKGAIIEAAYVELVSHEAKSAEDVALIDITGEAADNAAMFSEDALLTARTKTTAKVRWTVSEEWGLWTSHKTIDIKSIVQEIVNRDGWASGNALALFLMGTDEQGATEFESAREFESFENISDPEDGGDGLNHSERVPKLVINYNLGTAIKTNGKVAQSLEIFPNPASNSISIKLPSNESAHLSIYNVCGSQVLNQTMEAHDKIDISALINGLYIVTVQQNNTIYSQKIRVE